MLRKVCFVCLWITVIVSPSFAVDLESRLNGLEEVLKKHQKTIEEQQKMIEQLKGELATVKKQEVAAVPEKTPTILPGAEATPLTAGQAQAAVTEKDQKMSGISGLFGGSWMTNPYISFVLNSNFYSSSINERELKNRGMPGYSILGLEQKKGFNISEGELFLFAPVDPYFNLYANIPVTENGATLEEAYFVTTALPEGLQMKGGKFKSGISRFNAQHPHAWDFADAPLVYRAFTGKEGIIEKGVQFTYLPSLPFYTLLGVEVLQGENEVMFNQNATGGPHAFTGFAKTSFDFGDYSTLLFGPYMVGGQTRTDTVSDGAFFRGNSTLYGLETVYKWKPSTHRSFLLQGEYVLRNQAGTLENTVLGTDSRLTKSQDGAYIQGLYQIERWRLGARYDRLSLFKDDYRLAGAPQGFGSNPWRATGALEFNLSEFSRLRLQYNYDRSGGDGRTNNEIFLQFILGIGAHAAHAF
jgi:uncharacterized coiled-coil protein SlyX